MRKRIRRWERAAILGGLAALVFVLAAWPAAVETGGGEGDICKRALINCLADGFFGGTGLDQLTVLFRLEYCLAGYSFCWKYVSLYI